MIHAMLAVQGLRVFRALVASGSVHAAADHLGFMVESIGEQISALQR